MKLFNLVAITGLCLSLGACGSKGGSGNKAPAAPKAEGISNDPAKGKVSGKDWTFKSGLAQKKVMKDKDGKDVEMLVIVLTPKEGFSCEQKPTKEDVFVGILVPKTEAKHVQPFVKTSFTTFNAEGQPEYKMAEKKSEVELVKITATEVTGKVDATDGENTVVGSFTVKMCDEPAQNEKQPDKPADTPNENPDNK